MGLAKLKKMTNKSPKKIMKYLRRYIDESASKAIYGNVAGFKENLEGRRKISSTRSKLKFDQSKEPLIKELKKNAVLGLGNPYDKSLIETIQKKYNSLIENDEGSYVRTEYKGKAYSRQIKLVQKEIPELAQLLTDDIIQFIEGWYDGHFQVKYLICWRNYHVPPEVVKEAETFSDRWHCDRRSTDIFKLFVNISDVTEKDGPFHIQTIPRTKELMKTGFGNRHKYNLSKEVLEDPNIVVKAIGDAGTALLCNTELGLHKAGIPEKGHMRDIIQFQFVPSKKPLEDNWIEKIEIKPHEMRMTGDNPSIT